MIDVLRNSLGESLDFHLTAGDPQRRQVVVLSHGVTSHKDRPWLTALSEALAAAGLTALRFSFAGNGESEGRYEEATLSKEVEDLGCVLDALEGQHVAFVGHSMGGAIGVLRAAQDARIRALVSLAGMVHVQKFMEVHFGGLVPGRDVMLGKPHCPLSETFLSDARRIDTLLPQAPQLQMPWLIVHGTSDDIVPLQDSLDIVEAAARHPELVQLPGVDHRFTDHHEDLVDAVVPWVLRQMDALVGR
jgi:pimeloyl-ACP methyl ester carboxylesterase